MATDHTEGPTADEQKDVEMESAEPTPVIPLISTIKDDGKGGEPDKVEPTDVREPIECLSKTMNDDEGREESDHIEPTDDREDEKVLPRESSSLPFQEVARKDHPL